MKTTKGGKVMNPTDAYRKELRKKEIKRNKKERKKVREVGILKKDPEAIKDQIQKLEVMQADGALDKARKHKKRQLEDTLNLVMKKRKEYEDKMREKGEEPVMFSHLGPPRRRTAEEEERSKHLKPEDSVYYHPTLNPTGAPPPGKPPMYKSSIGPRVPLPTSASGIGSSSNTEPEEVLAIPPPPPPPLPASGEQTSVDGPDLLSSIPLPPPPPAPPRPVESASSSVTLGPPPLPGLPPKESVASSSLLPPPPPPLQRLPLPPPPPGINVKESENSKSAATEGSSLNDLNRVTSVLPPPPPPPGLPPKPASLQSDIVMSESSFHNASANIGNTAMATLLPPPPRGPPPMPQRIPMMMHPLQPEVLPPGMVRYPPPPDSRPPMMVPGIPNRPLPPPPPPGMVPPSVMMPPFGPPPGPPGFLRPPAMPIQEDDIAARPLAPQKPSYIKSAVSTVIKRPLAQHTPELTAMVPASVRVRRESVVPKAKPKPQTSIAALASRLSAPSVVKSDSVTSSAAPKPQSIDDSYMAFLEDMKELGALEG